MFLRVSVVPFYRRVVYHYMDVRYLLVEGQLGCFHILAVATNIAVNIHVQFSFINTTLMTNESKEYLEVGLLDHMATFNFSCVYA